MPEPAWIVVTLGMNPLPCFVETYRLMQELRPTEGPLPSLLLVYSEESGPAARTFKHLLEQRLGSPQNWSELKLTAPRKGRVVRSEVLPKLSRIPKTARVYFAHTGGTKPMIVAICMEMQSRFGNPVMAYLRADEHWIELDALQLESLSQLPTFEDDKTPFPGLALTFEELYSLHALELKSIAPSDADLQTASLNFLRVMHPKFREYEKWLNGWKDFKPQQPAWYRFCPGIPAADLDQAVDLVSAYPKWQGLWRREPSGGWSIYVDRKQKAKLEPLSDYLDNKALEHVAEMFLRQVAPGGAEIVHSARLMNPGANDFELDVAVLYGYELVVISCTMSGRHQTVKQKAFEVLHRARQLGGDNARAIVVSRIGDAKGVEDDLKDEVGLPGGQPQLRVFGAAELSDLSASFPRKLAYGFWEVLDRLNWPVGPKRP